MSRKHKQVLGFLLIVSVCAALLWFTVHEKRDTLQEVSLIVYGNDASRWENLRQGAELAFEEEQVELTLVTMSAEGDANEQIALIEREISRGADALLIAPYDSQVIGAYIKNNKPSIPYVFVENSVSDETTGYSITADHYEMGKMLGRKILELENPIVKVAVISDGTRRESVKEREKGLREVVEPFANKVVTWERYENETDMLTRKFLQRAILEEAVDVVVALDNDIADALMDALDNLDKKTKVYAISTSDQSVYYLDQGKIKALEYSTEFAIGYIGAEYILNPSAAKKKYSMDDIKYIIVSKGDMYEAENQTLLFPFVQ